MRLTGESVRFRLSPEGQQALSDLFPTKFSALVVQENDLGLWISLRLSNAEAAPRNGEAAARVGNAITVYLLKREYISTAELDMDAEKLADLIATEPL